MSERKLATVEKIAALDPIPGADAIEVATVRGWKVVVKKGEFAVGDLVIYCEIDSALPLDRPSFEFLRARGVKTIDVDGRSREVHVLRTVKLRGQVSQGLVIPVEAEHTAVAFAQLNANTNELVGLDVTKELCIVKYDPPVPAAMAGQVKGNFPTHLIAKTDAERVQNLGAVFEKLASAQWYGTEKADGCLLGTTPITMADGSTKALRDVALDDLVLGVNEDGDLVPSRVLNTFDNGLTDQWLNVKGERVNRGRGHHTFAVKATPNHRFYVSGRGYVAARDLLAGDQVLCLHYDITPTLVQRSILIGSMLGDGYLSRQGQFSFSHSIKQVDYHQWISAALGPVVRGTKTYESGYGSRVLRTNVARCHGMDWSGWDTPRGVIPRSVIQDMNPLVLAVWFMDDGSLKHAEGQEDRATLATNALSLESNMILVEALAKLGIAATIQESSKGLSIRINAESADLLFAMIAPYIPPSMQYKLPQYYRGSSGWIPDRADGYRPLVSEVKITSVDKLGFKSKAGSNLRYRKYDIETETHNFFASKILVHNSSVTFLNDGELRVCSRNLEQRWNEDLTSVLVATRDGLLPELGWGFQAEVVGPGIQSNRLKLSNHRLVVFGVYRQGDDHRFHPVPRDQWPEAYARHGAPILDLPFPDSVEAAVAQADGLKSVINPQVIAEGVVWHTADGSTFDELDGRECFKAINNRYLLKNGE